MRYDRLKTLLFVGVYIRYTTTIEYCFLNLSYEKNTYVNGSL